jgi:predicted DNA-binding transcriptional regulator AlpA
MKQSTNRLLSIEAAASRCSVSVKLIYREMKRGSLKFQRIVKLRRVSEGDLVAWLKLQQKQKRFNHEQ